MNTIFRPLKWLLFVIFSACLLVAYGCAVGGFKMSKADDIMLPDQSILTGSIPAMQPVLTDSIGELDKAYLRDRIASLNIGDEKLPLAWSNEQTGSGGLIQMLSQSKRNDRRCRNFETTRSAFDGAALYVGEICQAPSGYWLLTDLHEKEI